MMREKQYAADFSRVMDLCRSVAAANGKEISNQEIAIYALYVILSSYTGVNNPFLDLMENAFGIAPYKPLELPFSSFDHLVPDIPLEGDISVLYPYIDVAFWKIHEQDKEWIKYLTSSSFFYRYLQRGEAGDHKFFVSTNEYSWLFSEFFWWDFMNKRPYRTVGSIEDLEIRSLAENWRCVHMITFCTNIQTSLRTEWRRISIMNFRGSLFIVTPLKELSHSIGNVPELEGRALELDTPDLILADGQYLVRRFDWDPSQETRVITADGYDKVVEKDKFLGWLKGYVESKLIPLWKCFKQDLEVARLIALFEKEGYIKTVVNGMKYEWLQRTSELACLIYELWTNYGNGGSNVPSKKLLSYFSGFESIRSGENFRRQLLQYRNRSYDEHERNKRVNKILRIMRDYAADESRK